MPLFRKPLSELTAADIQGVIDRQQKEDIETEFKRELATKKGEPDRWMTDQSTIGDYAKEALTKEITAFANTQGGMLILGMAEDDEKRAVEIKEIPKCVALADRLSASIADCTDPKIISLEAIGVPLTGDAGVVVFSVPPSFRAPHRDAIKRESYRRRGDNSEPMTMREIQELTLYRTKRFEAVNQRLHDGQGLDYPFTWLGVDDDGGTHGPYKDRQAIGVRMRWQRMCAARGVAVPTEPAHLDGLTTTAEFHLPTIPLVEVDAAGKPKHHRNARPRQWTPMLRGIRYVEPSAGDIERREHVIARDGLLSIGWRGPSRLHPQDVSRTGVLAADMLEVFADVIASAHLLRIRLGRSELEFAMLFEWRIEEGVDVAPGGMYSRSDIIRCLEPYNRTADYILPRGDELHRLFADVERDYWNSCGRSSYTPMLYDFAASLERLLPKG